MFNKLRSREMSLVLPTHISNSYFLFLCIFKPNLIIIIQLTIRQHWSRQWLDATQVISHYLNQLWHNFRKYMCVNRPPKVTVVGLDLFFLRPSNCDLPTDSCNAYLKVLQCEFEACHALCDGLYNCLLKSKLYAMCLIFLYELDPYICHTATRNPFY